MKIALFHSLPSGGAKRALYETVRRLVANHTVDVYTLGTANHVFCDVRPLVRRHRIFQFQPSAHYPSPLGRLNNLKRWQDIYRLETLDRQIADEIDQHNYDLVYVHPSQWIQSPSLLHYLQTKSVYQVQESLRLYYEPKLSRPYSARKWRAWLDLVDPLIPLYTRKLTALDRRNINSATSLLANSQFTASTVQHIYGRNATVAYFGVDTNTFFPDTSVKKENFVLSVGELRPNKGYDFLIEALACIPSAKRPRLHIIGNASVPQEHAFLLRLAEQLRVELTIEVMVDMITLVRRYNQARLFVYAPVREPFGLVTLEAMACGTAVVGVAEGGVLETVQDGVTGALVCREHEAFAKAVSALLEDPEQIKVCGLQAREYVLDCWAWDKTHSRLEDCLNQLSL